MDCVVEIEQVQAQYSKAKPVLPHNSLTHKTSEDLWHVGSSGILCVVLTGAREIRSEWSYNGTELDTAEVSITTEDCVDCRREECIREAEQKARLKSIHRPVASVGKWKTPCFGVAPDTVSLMSFVRVPNATLQDSGDYIVNIKRNGLPEFSHLYHVTVGERCTQHLSTRA